TATDLEVGLNCILQGEVLAGGKVTVHARSIYDIVKELPEEVVHLTVKDGSWIEIRCGKSRYRIVGLSPDEFPELPSKGQGDVWRIDGALLGQMIERTSFAMSGDETRFNLNGVYLDPVKSKEEAKLKMVATDGHRLSIVEREVGAKCGIQKGAIVPRKGVSELKKIIESGEAPLDMWLDSKHLIVFRDNVTLAIRLIDGQFPPYEQVVPKSSKRVVSVERGALIHALKRVSVLSTDRARGVKFSVSTKNLEIFASNPDLGEAREELEADYKGETFEVGFNARYFIDALDAIEDDRAVLQMGDETSPCIIRSEKDRGFTHVIMPMRL
ncbi:MAG TPA: DNA polymerase III subunit beta, partial [bacterium]|nr:DNA polymerase III subunit beta [bacterium]